MTVRMNLPIGTDQVAGGPKHWAAVTHASRERAEREGRLTHFYLLDEASAACLAEPDPKKLREKLYLLLTATFDAIADTYPEVPSDKLQKSTETYRNVIEHALNWLRARVGGVKEIKKT